MAKTKTTTYICVICGGACSYSTIDVSLCERCQQVIQWLSELGVSSSFFVKNFFWLKELSEFFARGEDYGTFEGLVKSGKVVKADLTTTLLYKD